MNKQINKIFISAMIAACVLSVVGCTDLDETLYDTISSEQHEFSEASFHLRLGTEPQRFIANDSSHWGENHFLL